jgi:hypothetical protein
VAHTVLALDGVGSGFPAGGFVRRENWGEPFERDGSMSKPAVIFACLAALPVLSGCIVLDAAGAVVGATGAVVGGAVDLVTTSEDEQMKKDNARLKKENEDLKRQNKE